MIGPIVRILDDANFQHLEHSIWDLRLVEPTLTLSGQLSTCWTGASKKGKGQLPVLIGALFRGKEAHLSLHAGGNDMAQLKLPGFGVVTTS